jgi:hypothetical protein
MERKEGRGRPGAPNSQQEGTPQKEQAKPKRESELGQLFEERRLFAAWAPKGIDPESYPIEAMREIQDELDERIRRQYATAEYWQEDLIQGKRMKALEGILVNKMYSLRRSVDTVQKAYEIIAYPFCKNQELKKSIKKELELADDLTRTDKVELNDEELEVIGKMATIRRLPSDPEKRVYKYSEVPDFTTWLFRRHVLR